MTGLDSPQRSVETDKSTVRSGFQSFGFEPGSLSKTPRSEPEFLLLDSPYSQKSAIGSDSGTTTGLSKAASEIAKPASGQAGSNTSDSSKDAEKGIEKSKPTSGRLPTDLDRSTSAPPVFDWSKPASEQALDRWFMTPKIDIPDASKRPTGEPWKPLRSEGDTPSQRSNEQPGERVKPAQNADVPVRNSDRIAPLTPREIAPAREFNLKDRIRDSNIPDAKIYVPPGFDPSKPVNLIIYNHGWRDTASSAFRNANLRDQMAMAPPNSMLVIPAWQASEGAESSVVDSRFSRNLMSMLQGSLRTQGTDLNNVGSISLVSHSAGGTPVERELNAFRGTALYDRVSSVASLDTNYGVNQPAVDQWIAHNIQNGKFARNQAAFMNLYAGGTDDGSRAQAARVARMVSNSPGHGQLLDRGRAVPRGVTVRTQDLSRSPIVFQNTGDAHGRFPNKFFGYAISKVGNGNI